MYATYRSTGMMALAFEADGTGSAQWQNGSLRLSVTAETGGAGYNACSVQGAPLGLLCDHLLTTPAPDCIARGATYPEQAMTVAPQAGQQYARCACLDLDRMGLAAPAGKGALYDHSGAPVKTWSAGSGDAGPPEPICLQLDEHLVSAALERNE